MTLTVVLATHNRGKLAELHRLLAGLDVDLLGAGDVDLPEVEESGTTFEDNALHKAREAAKACGLPCLADDSGLVVDALGGEPGVRSARYAGAHGDDEANLRLVLERLEGAPDRSARFVCVAALVAPGEGEWTATGTVEGVLTDAPCGDGGFGYDPIFVPLGETRTTAEMSPAEKDAISHRGEAFRAIRPAVERLLRVPAWRRQHGREPFAVTHEETQSGKATFDDIYDQPDPRPYVRGLSALEYQTPEHARPLFSRLIRLLRARHGEPLRVADLCCSYGINAALLNHGVSLDELYRRYQQPELTGLSTGDLVDADRAFYDGRRRPDAVEIVGLDSAANAVGYAESVGLLAAGFGENLEEADASPALQKELADIGLVTVTGGIGYITEVTFDRVLAASRSGRPPWVGAFALRWLDLAEIAATLTDHGLELEALTGRTFRQRRFADDGEREYTFEQLHRRGVDPEGVETDGYHHTCFYLARPREDVGAEPLDVLLGTATGA